MNLRLGLLSLCALGLAFQSAAADVAPANDDVVVPVSSSATNLVQVATNLGDFYIELYGEAGDSPAHVINFLQYVRDGEYENSIFHRTVSKSLLSSIAVVQGGGFRVDGNDLTLTDDTVMDVVTRGPVPNEFDAANGLSNTRATVAAARVSDPDSAKSQWYVNVDDNSGLDDGPYTVFGAVVDGMDVVDAIEQLPHHNSDAFDGSQYENVFRELPMAAGGDFTVMYSITELDIQDADFNDDGNWDELDYGIWLDGFGTVTGALPEEGDANRDGAVDGRDFLLWQVQYSPTITGSSGGGGSLAGMVAAVPEPTGLALLIAGIVCGLPFLGRRR